MSKLQHSSKLLRAFLLTSALGAGPGVLCVSAELSSRNAPELARVLGEKVETDKNKDGVLSFDEYDAYLRTQGEKKPANPISMAVNNGDLLITDFEENNLGKMGQWGWKIEGQAFRHDLNQSTRMMKRRAGSFSGRYLLTSFAKSDAPTGRLLSPEFEIAQSHIAFLVSGGEFAGETGVCVNLIVDGKIVRSVSGRNDDQLEAIAFQVDEFQGQQAQIEIVDAYSGLWGHINVDRIFQTNHPGTARVIAERPKPAALQSNGMILMADNTRLSGAGEIEEGLLQAGDQSLGPADFLMAIRDGQGSEEGQPKNESALRMINGEIWKVRKISFEDGKLSIQSRHFGNREVPLDQVASVDLNGGPQIDAGEPGNLYRSDGDPVPGKLIWIRDKDVAIDCALGVVPLPREKVSRFVFAKVDAKAGAKAGAGQQRGDEISLSDGTLLFGKLSFEKKTFSIEHLALAKEKLPWTSVRYVRRAGVGLTWLDLLEPAVVERRGPALPPPLPRVIAFGEDEYEYEDDDGGGAGHLRAIRMMPRTVVSYAIPAAGQANEEGKRMFYAQVAPLAGCRADVLVRLLASEEGSVLWERKIGAAEKAAIPVSVELPGSDQLELTIEVDFAGPLAFPCGVDWLDAHVLASANTVNKVNPDKPTKTD